MKLINIQRWERKTENLYRNNNNNSRKSEDYPVKMANTENHHLLVLKQTAIIYYVQIVPLHLMLKERFCVVYASCQKLISTTWRLTRKNLLVSAALVWTNKLMLESTKNPDKSKVGIPFGPYLNLRMKKENSSKVCKHQNDQVNLVVNKNQYLKCLNRLWTQDLITSVVTESSK